MKLGLCEYHNKRYVFIDTGTHLLLPALADTHIAWRDMGVLINDYATLGPILTQILMVNDSALRVEYTAVRYLAPHYPMQNVMCLGLNYLEHAQESAHLAGRDGKAPTYPIVFTKAVSSIIGHNSVIPFDIETCAELDWECELGVIIGKTGIKISRENALEHVFGYTVINDLSARDIQRNHKQFFLGKSLDGGCPMGPHIVTADAIPNPQALRLQCRVNGVTKQDSNTRLMVFDIAAIIETISRSMTLHAGDIIATGTPSGVGFARTPPEFLKPADVVECEVEGIGILRNTIG